MLFAVNARFGSRYCYGFKKCFRLENLPVCFESGTIWRYEQNVGPARYGAVTHPGAAAEDHVYADI
jgi:hypothetical protein